MFLSQIKKHSNTEFWRYMVGSGVVIAFSLLGQIPLFLGWIVKLGVAGMQDTPQSKLMQILDSNTTLVLIMLSFVFALFGLLLVVKKLHHQSFKTIVTARSKVDWKRILFSFALFGIFVCVSTYIDYQSNPEHYEWNFKLFPFLGLLVIAIILIPIQTSVEEFVFRGYLMQGFAKFGKNRFFGLFMTSVIFGGMHLANPEVQELGYIVMVYYISTGFFLGILTLMDDGMELALGFHAANNLVTALLVTADWTVLQTNSVLKDISEPSIGYEILIPVVVIYPILLFIFAKRYNWTNWKQRLFGSL